ncbi:hypothetical protein [Mesorhizobium sp. M1272]|uniref:hypothetical protein n=1 Tax=Mesorhizobium sp. M1272 TaxID=2957074 RepID=UPI003339C9CE
MATKGIYSTKNGESGAENASDKLERTLSVVLFLIVFTCTIFSLFFNIDAIRTEISYSKLFSDETRRTIESDPFLSVFGFFALFSLLVISLLMALLLVWRFTAKIAGILARNLHGFLIR